MVAADLLGVAVAVIVRRADRTDRLRGATSG